MSLTRVFRDRRLSALDTLFDGTLHLGRGRGHHTPRVQALTFGRGRDDGRPQPTDANTG